MLQKGTRPIFEPLLRLKLHGLGSTGCFAIRLGKNMGDKDGIQGRPFLAYSAPQSAIGSSREYLRDGTVGTGTRGTKGQKPFPHKLAHGEVPTAAIPDWNHKIKNAITFFAWEHERLLQEPLAVTTLHRYLAFFDYASSEKTGRPAFGLHSRGMGRALTEPCKGPETREDDSFLLIPHKGQYTVKATKEPDLSCFSSFELGEMKRLVEGNADPLAKAPRKRGDAQDETWAEIKKAVMDVSEVNLFTKPKEVGNMSGLTLLTEKYTTQLSELENTMAELRRKLETVAEASRLLEEEGLSEEEPKPRWP